MSVVEKIDPHSGAILFKKDKESKDIENALKEIEDLKRRVRILELIIEKGLGN